MVGGRFGGKHRNPDYFELARNPLLGGTLKAVEAPTRFYANKANRRKSAEELCLRQSTGNSTSPQVDISPDRL